MKKTFIKNFAQKVIREQFSMQTLWTGFDRYNTIILVFKFYLKSPSK